MLCSFSRFFVLDFKVGFQDLWVLLDDFGCFFGDWMFVVEYYDVIVQVYYYFYVVFDDDEGFVFFVEFVYECCDVFDESGVYIFGWFVEYDCVGFVYQYVCQFEQFLLVVVEVVCFGVFQVVDVDVVQLFLCLFQFFWVVC